MGGPERRADDVPLGPRGSKELGVVGEGEQWTRASASGGTSGNSRVQRAGFVAGASSTGGEIDEQRGHRGADRGDPSGHGLRAVVPRPPAPSAFGWSVTGDPTVRLIHDIQDRLERRFDRLEDRPDRIINVQSEQGERLARLEANSEPRPWRAGR